MARHQILNDQDVQHIVFLREQGFTLERIAEKLFVSRCTVASALRRRNIGVKTRKKLEPEQIAKILDLKSQGLSNLKIGKKMGISPNTIAEIVDRNKLKSPV